MSMTDMAGETMGEFEDVLKSLTNLSCSWCEEYHENEIKALVNAHLLDIAAKDERIAVLEQITQHPLYEHLVKAEARITELEAQVQELIEELIEELKESANSAIESRSKEYAIKRLAQLTEGGK